MQKALPCARTRGKEKEGDDFRERHRKQRAARRQDRVMGKAGSRKQPRANFDELLDDLGERRWRHDAPALPVPPKHRDERDGQDGGRKGKIALREGVLPLQCGDGKGERRHHRRPAQPQKGEQLYGVTQGKLPAPPRGALRRDRPRHDRRDAHRGEGEHQAKERVRHLIQSRAVPAQKIGERNAVHNADRLGGKSPEGDDRRIFQKNKIPLHASPFA